MDKCFPLQQDTLLISYSSVKLLYLFCIYFVMMLLYLCIYYWRPHGRLAIAYLCVLNVVTLSLNKGFIYLLTYVWFWTVTSLIVVPYCLVCLRDQYLAFVYFWYTSMTCQTQCEAISDCLRTIRSGTLGSLEPGQLSNPSNWFIKPGKWENEWLMVFNPG